MSSSSQKYLSGAPGKRGAHDDPLFSLPFYGRRKGRPLRPRAATILEAQLKRWRIRLPDSSTPVFPTDLFPFSPKAIWLEIGFGNGEHMLWQATTHPHIGILGCEPFINGLAQCCSRMAKHTIGNIRLYDGDARLVIAALAPAMLDRVFILFPDPWPKRRHHKRRLVNRHLFCHLKRVLKPDAEIHLATDDPDYAEWMMFEVRQAGGFSWLAHRSKDWQHPPDGRLPTRYEVKARKAGRPSYFLHLRKQATP